MDWLMEVEQRVKKKNMILFTKNSEPIQKLQCLIDKQSHRTVALWAFALADEAADQLLKRYPDEIRPKKAIERSKAWASGEVKMPVAQRAILDAHAFAKELTCPEDVALCHAVGQACGVVHTTGHAIGFPIYDLTAIVRRYGVNDCREAVENRIAEYVQKMLFWEKHDVDSQYTWAEFMMRDSSL